MSKAVHAVKTHRLHTRRPLRAASLCLLLPALALLASCATPRDSGQGVHIDAQGRAAGGADVVAYRSLDPEADSVPGSEEFSLSWRGAQWLFSSAGHRETFSSDQALYAPRYGGYCARAMARNVLASGDPDIWVIDADRLYLFATERGRREWLQDPARFIDEADGNWREYRATRFSREDEAADGSGGGGGGNR